LSLAVGIPVSGWMADRFGTRVVFGAAVALFTFSSVLCGLAVSVPMLVATRILQGIGAAMMMPVGRLAIIRTFPKSELLMAMNFVIIPALIGPLLGPTVGGLIVHWLSWRDIFFVNVPVGLAALVLIHRHMPDYRGEAPRPLDLVGLVLFGSGTALLSWLLEIFGEHNLDVTSAAILLLLSISLLAAYGWHSRQTSYPLLRLGLFRVRTFRVSTVGGFITRLGVGGLPFLLPLLYQLGLGLPAWQSGLLMMPTAAAAMGMKLIAVRVLRRYGFRQVLIVNTLMIGLTIIAFSLVTPPTPVVLIVVLGLALGLFNSLQFSSMNAMAYADIEPSDSSMASTIASTLQQMSMSFGLACGSLITGWYLGDVPQTDRVALTNALHHAFLTLGGLTILSSLSFWTLRSEDGDKVSKGSLREAEST
jgi:EmrB/QacA subfamily drug resistance transporter